MKIKTTSIFLCIVALIVLALTIIDIEPPESAKATITNADYPTTATGGDHVGLNITTTIKNVGGTRGIFGVIAQPDYARTEGVWIEPGGECIFSHIAGVYMPDHDYNIQLQAYCFINESYRIDYTKNITILVDELPTFREQCLHNGVVVCEWNVLKNWLEDQTVSRIWWDLTRDERYSIAVEAIRNNPYGKASGLELYRGDAYCAGAFGEPMGGSCASSAAIRYTKFGGQAEIIDYMGPGHTNNIDGCYFKLAGSNTIQCYRQPNPYMLPCHFVHCVNEDAGRRHVLSAIQIVNSLDSLDNLVVFQYNDVDIKPGDAQMQPGVMIVIFTRSRIGLFGTDSRMEYSTTIAEFPYYSHPYIE